VPQCHSQEVVTCIAAYLLGNLQWQSSSNESCASQRMLYVSYLLQCQHPTWHIPLVREGNGVGGLWCLSMQKQPLRELHVVQSVQPTRRFMTSVQNLWTRGFGSTALPCARAKSFRLALYSSHGASGGPCFPLLSCRQILPSLQWRVWLGSLA
jgi:hypothetical protein